MSNSCATATQSPRRRPLAAPQDAPVSSGLYKVSSMEDYEKLVASLHRSAGYRKFIKALRAAKAAEVAITEFLDAYDPDDGHDSAMGRFLAEMDSEHVWFDLHVLRHNISNGLGNVTGEIPELPADL